MPAARTLASRCGIGLMALLAAGVAFYSWRYAEFFGPGWPPMDAKLRAMAQQFPVRALTHMLIAPIALLTGPFQFIAWIRQRHPRIHRWLGRIYIGACLIGGLAAFATALHASGGPVAAFGFGTLAVCWLATTWLGWRAAVHRQFARHRLLMRFNYAMTFAAVTLRIQIPLGAIAFGFKTYASLSVWLAYTSWIPNVIVVALYTRWERRLRTQTIPD